MFTRILGFDHSKNDSHVGDVTDQSLSNLFKVTDLYNYNIARALKAP